MDEKELASTIKLQNYHVLYEIAKKQRDRFISKAAMTDSIKNVENVRLYSQLVTHYADKIAG